MSTLAAAKAAHCLRTYHADPRNPMHSKIGCLEKAMEIEARYGPLVVVERCRRIDGTGRQNRNGACPDCGGTAFIPASDSTGTPADR